MSNQQAINAVNQGIVARFDLPKYPSSGSIADRVSYYFDLAVVLSDIAARQLAPNESWCLLSPVDNRGLDFSSERQAVSELYSPDPSIVQLAIIKTPYKRTVQIEVSEQGPVPRTEQGTPLFQRQLISSTSKRVEIEAVDLSELTFGRFDKVIDFLANQANAAAESLTTPAEQAAGQAVSQSWSFYADCKILKFRILPPAFVNLSPFGELASSAGPVDLPTQKKNNGLLWALAIGAGVGISPSAAIPFALLALRR